MAAPPSGMSFTELHNDELIVFTLPIIPNYDENRRFGTHVILQNVHMGQYHMDLAPCITYMSEHDYYVCLESMIAADRTNI